MSTVGPWGALPQATGVVEAIDHRAGFENKHTEDDDGTMTGTTSTLRKGSTDDSHDFSDEHVTNLARALTQHSVKNAHGEYENPFTGSDDPALNPSSGKFNATAWTKTLIGITSRDPERYPTRTAGISYRNLGVHGFGKPTDYQKTFGNYPLEVTGLLNRIRGRGQHKIQILNNFDGLIKSGEMLVVLGRPGR